MEDRFYVIYGTGFKALKIKGLTNKNKVVNSLKLKGFSPKTSLLNPNSSVAKKCKTTPTLY